MSRALPHEVRQLQAMLPRWFAPALLWSVGFACHGRRIPAKLRRVPLELLALLAAVYARRLP